MDVEETISHYDEIARHYATLIDDQPPGWIADALGRLRARVVPDAPILEIGSGVGRDANWLEARGTHVRRTDATPEFREIQRERGHHVDLLNVVSDDLGGPYGGALAMAVLMHIPRTSIGDVLAKLAASLSLRRTAAGLHAQGAATARRRPRWRFIRARSSGTT